MSDLAAGPTEESELSLKSREARRLALASVAALSALGASSAQAAQDSVLNYKCKFPLIGTQPLSLEISLNIPDTWEAGVETEEFGITAKALAKGTTSTALGLVEGLKVLSAVSEAEKPGLGTASRARVNKPEGGGVNVRVPIDVEPYTIVPPIPNPLVLNASGKTPPLTFDVPGEATINLTELILNLKGRDENGLPTEGLVTPPTDINRVPYKDIDGDPDTFNVPCILDPDFPNQSLQVGKFTITAAPVEDVTDPSIPTEVDGQDGDLGKDFIVARWGASTDEEGGSGLKEYRVDWEGAPEGGVKVPAGTTNYRITGLGAGSDYDVFVSAIDNAGNESDPVTLYYSTLPPENVPPTAPTNVTGTATTTSVSLSWSPASDIDGQVVKYNVYNGTTKVGESTTTSATISSLTPGTAYSFTVEAVDNAGAPGPKSDAFPITTGTVPPPNTPPTKPADFKGVADKTSVALSWTASTDNGAVTGYDVLKDGVKVATVTGTTYNAAGLSEDTTYKFQVVANDNGTPVLTTASDEISVKTLKTDVPPPNTPPTKPADFKGVADKTSVALSWTASTDNGAVTGYDVYKDGVKVATVTGTTYNAAGLSEDTTYKFKVVANDNGTPVLSTSSDEISVKTLKTDVPPPNTPPTKPADLKGVADKTSVALSWTASTDNGAVTGYDVLKDGVKVATVTGTTYNAVGLSEDTTYKFKVVANDNGTPVLSTSSDEISVKTLKTDVPPPNTPPTKPTELKGVAAKTSVALSWKASTDNGAVTGYDVLKDGVKVATVTGTSYNAVGLSEDTTYKFQVVANDNGTPVLSTSSDEISVKTLKTEVPVGNVPVVNSIIGKTAFARIGGIALVQGTNFKGVSSVTVGGKKASTSSLGGNLILVVLPPLAKGTYDLVVTNAAGSSAATAATKIKYISLF